MIANRSMPQSAVTPVLSYPDLDAATAWLCDAFGFAVRLRIGDHRVQLSAGEGDIVIAAGTATPAGHSIMVRTDAVDAHREQALQSGARIVTEIADYPFGERQYTVLDLADRAWTFSQSIADVDPADWGGRLI